MTIGIDIKVEGHKDEEQWYKNAGVQNDMIDVFFFFFFFIRDMIDVSTCNLMRWGKI